MELEHGEHGEQGEQLVLPLNLQGDGAVTADFAKENIMSGRVSVEELEGRPARFFTGVKIKYWHTPFGDCNNRGTSITLQANYFVGDVKLAAPKCPHCYKNFVLADTDFKGEVL